MHRRNPFGISKDMGLEIAQDIFKVNPDLDESELGEDMDLDDDLHEEDDGDELEHEDDDELEHEDDDELEHEDDDELEHEDDDDLEHDVEESIGGIASYYRNPFIPRGPRRHNPRSRRKLQRREEREHGELCFCVECLGHPIEEEDDGDSHYPYRRRSRRNPFRRRNLDDGLTTDSSGRLSLSSRRRRNVGAPAWGGSLYQPRWNSTRRRRNVVDPTRLVAFKQRRNAIDPARLTSLRRWNPLARTSRWTHPHARKTTRWAPPVCKGCGSRDCDGFCATPYRRNPWGRSRRRLKRNDWGTDQWSDTLSRGRRPYRRNA